MSSPGVFAGEATNSPDPFADRLRRLDIGLYGAITAELTPADRRSLLALQSIVRERKEHYTYLEIGSHLGGSIQPHLLDSRCYRIHSIDPRPALQSDARGSRFAYPRNTSAQMLDNLRRLAPERVACVHVHETDACDLDPGAIAPEPDLVLIDGEHTDAAVQSDFAFVQSIVRAGGVIAFHDASIVYAGLAQIVERLRRQNVKFSAFPLPDTLFIIVLHEENVLQRGEFAPLADAVGTAYLTALCLNQGYRRFHGLLPFRVMRWGLRRLGLGGLLVGYAYGDIPHEKTGVK